jgi:dolichol-phosphate mannosyltransferase
MQETLFSLQVEGLELLVVDDNSPDGTGKIADELARLHPGRVHVLHRPGKQGLGPAYKAGFTWALDNGAEYIVQMDADFSHSPHTILVMLEQIKNYDCVVGSRYVQGGRVDSRWGFNRWFLSWWANSIWVRLILGTMTRDATAGYKCWRASALRAINLANVRANGYVFQVEMAYLAEQLGQRILEVPIYFEDRRIGRSKMSMRVKIEAALRVFEIRWRYRNLRLSRSTTSQ